MTRRKTAQLDREIEAALSNNRGGRVSKITVEDSNDRATASRSTDDDGWIVEISDGHEKQKRFYADSGGSWLMQKNGTLGRQLRGTRDERAPKSTAKMRSFLRSRVLGTL